MRRSTGAAVALWFVLAFVVFNVTFDWDMRAAGNRFARSQVARHEQGLPPHTINQEFRPMVRAAARQSLVWFALIFGTGSAAIGVAARRRPVTNGNVTCSTH